MLDSWWLTTVYGLGPVYLAAWVIWAVLHVTLHELAHGWVALMKGDPTPEASGHMTFNPVVHMGTSGLIFFAICGMPMGSMPVDSTRLRGRHADALVALAGPGMNFVLALLCILGLGCIFAISGPGMGAGSRGFRMAENLTVFCWIGGVLNIGIGLFNLLPIPPMDGSWIARSYSRAYRDFSYTEIGGFLSMLAFAVAFLFAGRLTFGAGALAVGWGARMVADVLRVVGVGP